MNEKEKDPIKEITTYVPFTQKTGIMYNWYLSFVFLGSWTVAVLLQIFHGLLYDPSYHSEFFSANFIKLTFYPILYWLFNWVYRNTVADVKEIFFNDPKFKNLFKDEATFLEYRTNFIKTLHSKKEYFFIIPFYVLMWGNFINAIMTVETLSPLFIIGSFMDSFLYSLIAASLGSMAYYVITVFYTFYKFKKEEELSISTYTDWFNSMLEDSQIESSQKLNTTLYSFQHDTRVIGRFLFIFFFRFVILLVIADLSIYLPSIIFPDLKTGAAAAYWVPGTLILILLFVLSQYKIHLILKSAKEKVSDGLNTIYNNLKTELYQTFSEKNWEGQKSILKKISFIKEEIQEISGMGTWTFDYPEVFKIVGAALLTIVPLVLEFLPIW